MKIPQGLYRIEQETFYRTTAADDTWDVYTRDPVFKRLLERRGYTVKEDHQGMWSCQIPRAALTLRSRKSLNRVMSEEDRQRAKDRLIRGKLSSGVEGKQE